MYPLRVLHWSTSQTRYSAAARLQCMIDVVQNKAEINGDSGRNAIREGWGWCASWAWRNAQKAAIVHYNWLRTSVWIIIKSDAAHSREAVRNQRVYHCIVKFIRQRCCLFVDFDQKYILDTGITVPLPCLSAQRWPTLRSSNFYHKSKPSSTL
jgi:hypothetical protein